MSEKALYEPIRKELIKRFSKKGQCTLEITADGISEDLKKVLKDKSVFLLEAEKRKPDLVGYADIKEGFLPKRKLITVEIKNKTLTLSDIYQIKKYAEMLCADYAFLISTSGFKEAIRLILKSYPLLTFIVNNDAEWYEMNDSWEPDIRYINVMTYQKGSLKFIEDISHSYMKPFSNF